MAFKFVTLLSLLAVASAGVLPAAHQHGHSAAYNAVPVYHQQPIHSLANLHSESAQHAAPALVKTVSTPVHFKHAEVEAPAHYDFSYSVHDEHTGDIKQQRESRRGDKVKGQYSLLDSDGHHRIVDYSADAHSGFNAHVRREPTGHHQVAHQAKYVAPAVQHAKIVAPVHHQELPSVHYATPIAHQIHSAPVVHQQQIHSAPLEHHQQIHSAPLVHQQQIHSAPAVHYAAPAAHHTQQIHSAPLEHHQQIHSAPLEHHQQIHSAPAIHYSAPVALHSQQIHAAPLVQHHEIQSAPVVHSHQIHAAPLVQHQQIYSAPSVHSEELHAAQYHHQVPVTHSKIEAAPLGHAKIVSVQAAHSAHAQLSSVPVVHQQQYHSVPVAHSEIHSHAQVHSAPIVHQQQYHSAPSAHSAHPVVYAKAIKGAPLEHSSLNSHPHFAGHGQDHSYSSQQVIKHSDNHHSHAYHH